VADDFLSGTTGAHTGRRAALEDVVCDAALAARAVKPRLARAAAAAPAARRRVLVVTVESAGRGGLAAPVRAELARSRHDVSVVTGPAGDRGKFENLNRLLADQDLGAVDWLVALDDDVTLPSGFLDGLLFLAERFSFSLAQPAHRRRSHAAWAVTRRVAGLVARRTAFVEIGPVTAFSGATNALRSSAGAWTEPTTRDSSLGQCSAIDDIALPGDAAHDDSLRPDLSPALKASAGIDDDDRGDRVLEMGNASHYPRGPHHNRHFAGDRKSVFGVITLLRPRYPDRRCPREAG